MQQCQDEMGRILISCPDRPGIVAAVSRFLFDQGANIVHSDQHSTDPTGGVFFMRVEFQLPHISAKEADLKERFSSLAAGFAMQWKLSLVSRVKRLAIFVSKQEHALLELLWRKRAGDLNAEIVLVISNHPDLEKTVTSAGIPFHHISVNPKKKKAAEEKQIALIKGKVELVVLARYMQILTPYFMRQCSAPAINIHHSFLPAFAGGNPYIQAYKRGVKLIGATAHYVTKELDAGPIIDQDIERVNHRYGIEAFKQIGRQIERRVLARAVIWHVEDRILVYGNKTIVFA
jgi:formyltetrahydrofolate deformylase